MKTYEDRWERFLDPDVVRPSLFTATMFITTFEILKNSIVEQIRSFYVDSWSSEGIAISGDYEVQVLSKNKSTLYASLGWLLEHEVINQQDLDDFERLKKTRNLVAHQLFEVVTGEVNANHIEEFPVLVALLRKIEVWWIVNVELAVNPDYDGQEVDEEGIVPFGILSLQILLEVAGGSTALLEAWRKGRAKK